MLLAENNTVTARVHREMRKDVFGILRAGDAERNHARRRHLCQHHVQLFPLGQDAGDQFTLVHALKLGLTSTVVLEPGQYVCLLPRCELLGEGLRHQVGFGKCRRYGRSD